jgi:microcystin-dependent protein
MAEPFLSEIRIVAFSFAPRNWAFCDGRLMSISQNTALFSLLGNTFGGDGRSTFGLPDLRGRAPVGLNNRTFDLGLAAGEETHILNVSELPAHTHALNATTDPASSGNPVGNLAATSDPTVGDVYGSPTQLVPMATGAIQLTGGDPSRTSPTDTTALPHENMQPFLTLNFIICLAGVFPSRS